MVRVKIMPQETFIIIALYNVSSCSLNFSPSWTLPSLFYKGYTNECICLMNSISLPNLSAHAWWGMVIALMRKWQCLFLAISHHYWKSQASDTRFHAYLGPQINHIHFSGAKKKKLFSTIKVTEIQNGLHKIYRNIFCNSSPFKGIMYTSSNLLTLGRIQQNLNTATTNLENVVWTCETWIWKVGSTKLRVLTSEHQDNFQYWLQELFANVILFFIRLGQLNQFYLSPKVGMLG